LKNSNFITAGL